MLGLKVNTTTPSCTFFLKALDVHDPLVFLFPSSPALPFHNYGCSPGVVDGIRISPQAPMYSSFGTVALASRLTGASDPLLTPLLRKSSSDRPVLPETLSIVVVHIQF